MVGALVVKDGEIVTDGFHRRAGELHGEAIALQAVGLVACSPARSIIPRPEGLDPAPDAGRRSRTPNAWSRRRSRRVSRLILASVEGGRVLGGRPLMYYRRSYAEWPGRS